MSQGPLGSPFPQGAPMGPSPAAGKVAVPAILLMISGGIGILHALFMVVMGLVGPPPAQAPPEIQGNEQQMQMFNIMANLQGPVLIGLGALAIIVSGLVLFGGLKMKSLESYGLAMTGSILAMLPCSLGCCLGLFIGIWSLVVLMDANVKSAFR